MSAPTRHARLAAWVAEVAELTQPDAVHWVDGSPQEYQGLVDQLVAAGTFVKLTKKKDSYWCASDPGDVARVEDRTYICSREAGRRRPHQQLVRPGRDAHRPDRPLPRQHARSHHVRHPVRDGPPRRRRTDVRGRDHRLRLRRRLDGRHGTLWHRRARAHGHRRRLRALPALGRRAARARPAGRRLALQHHQVHRPLPRDPRDLVVRLGLRRQRPARQEVLRAADRLGDGPRRGLDGRAHAHPQAHQRRRTTVHYIAAAFPSACGKTNLAMLEPTIPGWKVEMVGDDIAWMRFGKDGRLYAVNPEAGLFGVAPGTGWGTNPNAMRAIEKGGSVFTNVALTDDGDVWWEGMTDETPAHLTDWKRPGLDAGERRAVVAPELAVLHPDHQLPDPGPRVRRPAGCADLGDPVRRPAQVDHPAGHPVPRLEPRRLPRAPPSRARPPLPQPGPSVSSAATRWRCCPSSATTPATTSSTGSNIGKERRRRQAAEDLLRQLVPQGRRRQLPLAGLRREQPGAQVGDRAGSTARPRRSRPRSAWCRPSTRSTSTGSTSTSDQLHQALDVDHDEWAAELPLIEEWFAKIGDKVPSTLRNELDTLRAHLEA